MKIFLLLLMILFQSITINLFGQNLKLVEAANKIVDKNIIYAPSYIRITYPMGDVDPKTGVCTDVIIRAYRNLGIDLQKEVHEDMKANFDKYPKKWGMTT